MAQGLGAGSRHSPRRLLDPRCPTDRSGPTGKIPLGWLRSLACVLGPQVPGRAFPSGVGGRESAAGLSLGALCARARGACVPVGEMGQVGLLRVPGQHTCPLGRPSSSTSLFCHCAL